MKNDYIVKKISRNDCEPFVIGIHYAKRWPSISYAFGLFRKDSIVGIVSFGTPASSTLRKGIAGEKFEKDVLELNRLCLINNIKNEASILVSRAIKMLPKNKIIISFADTSAGHTGIVYQACNFLYLGLSAKRTDWAVRGREGVHGQTIADEFRGVKNRAAEMRKKYGDDFYLKPRSIKHRYLFISGGSGYKKAVNSSIRYNQLPYPKG